MPAKARDLQKAAKKLGFQIVRQKGSHARWKHPDGRATTIPVHGHNRSVAGFFMRFSSNWA
jgi:predicted RNA binding protein YcfA (HicA-like mRNA interferase family)